MNNRKIQKAKNGRQCLLSLSFMVFFGFPFYAQILVIDTFNVDLKEFNFKNVHKPEKIRDSLQLQLVSKKTFMQFPADELNRFNVHAPFFYDNADQHIKSKIYFSVDSIPPVYPLRNDMDTVITKSSVIQLSENQVSQKGVNVSFDVQGTELPGDIANMLLRLPYEKSITNKKNYKRVVLKSVEEVNVIAIRDLLSWYCVAVRVEIH